MEGQKKSRKKLKAELAKEIVSCGRFRWVGGEKVALKYINRLIQASNDQQRGGDHYKTILRENFPKGKHAQLLSFIMKKKGLINVLTKFKAS